MTVDARPGLPFQVHVALDPRAEVVRVPDDAVLGLACLNTAEAADALGDIDAVGPSVLRPVVVLGGEGRQLFRPLLLRGQAAAGQYAGARDHPGAGN